MCTQAKLKKSQAVLSFPLPEVLGWVACKRQLTLSLLFRRPSGMSGVGINWGEAAKSKGRGNDFAHCV